MPPVVPFLCCLAILLARAQSNALGPSSAVEMWVDANAGADSLLCGASEAPCRSIGWAVGHSPSSAQVFVRDGDYLAANNSNLILTGNRTLTAVGRSARWLCEFEFYRLFVVKQATDAISATQVRVSGFDIRCFLFQELAIVLVSGSLTLVNVSLFQVEVRALPVVGVALETHLTLRSCTLSGSPVQFVGVGQINSLTLIDSLFVRCPGAVFATLVEPVVIQRCRFVNNSGALRLTDSVVSAQGVVFAGNSQWTDTDSGAVFAQTASRFACRNCTFESNVIRRAEFAVAGGGALSLHGASSAVLDGCLLRGNRAQVDAASGGAFLLRNGASLTVRDSELSDHDAFNGGVAEVQSSSWVRFVRCTVTAARARNVGGMVHATSAPTDTPSVRIEDCNIRKAVASGVSAGAGGALFLDDQSSGLIRGSGFSECAADIAGGVVAVAAGTRLTILGSFFTDNRAVGDGGVFAVPANSGLVQLSISGSKFELNKARRGGVMAVLATRALVARIVNSSFTLNSASFGGLGYLDPRSNITWSGVRFRFNSATAGWGDHLLLSMPAVPNHAVNLCPPSDALPGVFAEAGDNKTLVTEFSRVVQPVNSKTFIPSNPVPLQLLLVDCFGNVVRGFEVAPLITVFSDAECVGSIHNFQMSTAAAIGDLTIQLEFLKQPRNGGASCRLAVVVDVPHLVTYATLFVRPCNPGFGLDPQLLECSKCNTGTYFSNNGSACLQCPANAQCLTGTAAVANVEYWLNERDVATFRCLPGFCVGEGKCKTDRLQPSAGNFDNPLCGRCPKYQSAVLSKCTDCSESRPVWIVLLFFAVWAAVLLFKSASQTTSAQLGILINFASVYSLLLNPYEDVVLPQITALFTFGSGSGGSAGDFSCMFGNIGFHGKGLLKLTLPFVALAQLWLAFLLEPWVARGWRECKSRCGSSELPAATAQPNRFSQYVRGSVAVFVACQGTLLQLGMQSLLPCLFAGSAGSFLVADPVVPCSLSVDGGGNATLRVLFAVSGAVALLLVLLLIACVVRKRRRLPRLSLQSRNDEQHPFEVKFGTLYENFRPGLESWQLVITLQRAALISAYVLSWHEPQTREISINTLNVAFFLAHLMFRPYRNIDASSSMPSVAADSSSVNSAAPASAVAPPAFLGGSDNVFEALSLFALCFLFDASVYLQFLVTICLVASALLYVASRVRPLAVKASNKLGLRRSGAASDSVRQPPLIGSGSSDGFALIPVDDDGTSSSGSGSLSERLLVDSKR